MGELIDLTAVAANKTITDIISCRFKVVKSALLSLLFFFLLLLADYGAICRSRLYIIHNNHPYKLYFKNLVLIILLLPLIIFLTGKFITEYNKNEKES
jgi:hypothetical protein